MAGLLGASLYLFWATSWGKKTSFSDFLQGPKNPTVRISYIDDPSSSLILLARAKSFFSSRGLQVEFRPRPNALEAVRDVLTGQADYAQTSSGPFISAVAEGAPLEILTETHLSMRSAYFLTRSGEASPGLPDLRNTGKRVAVVEREPDDFMLNLYLLSQGLDLKSPQLVRAKFQEADRLFQSGAVDMLLLWQSYALDPRYTLLKGYRTEEVTGIPDFSFLVRRSGGGAPDLDDRLLEALYDAQNFLAEHRNEANQMIAIEMGVELQTEFVDWTQQLEPGLGLSNALIRMLQEELRAKIALKHGMKVEPASFDQSRLRSLLSPSALLKVSPRAVTVL